MTRTFETIPTAWPVRSPDGAKAAYAAVVAALWREGARPIRLGSVTEDGGRWSVTLEVERST